MSTQEGGASSVSRPCFSLSACLRCTRRRLEATCVAVHTGAVVIGTKHGTVLQLDHAGSQTARLGVGAQLLTLSLSADGRFCACGSADGRVTVLAVGGGAAGEPWPSEHGPLAVLGVALCPEYGSPGADTGTVVSGGEDGRLLLHRRSSAPGEGFGTKALHGGGEGPVSSVAWRASLVAWANGLGVKVLNVRSGQRVAFIARPPPSLSGGSSFSPCSLSWAADDALLVGWPD